MARKNSTDLFSSLRSQGLRKGVAKALADLEKSGKKGGGKAESLARQAIADLRSAADTIEKRLNIGGAGTRSTAAKKAATTRKRSAAKRSSAARKGAAKRASTKRSTTTARKATTRAAGTARTAVKKATGATKTARKSTARKTTTRKRAARKSS
jgi:DNA-binding protein HU-beta